MINFPAIAIYDTTLRDGAQTEGLSLSVEDKLQIAYKLDRLGIPFIEGGWPGANPKDIQFFARLQAEPLKHSQIVPFCMTRRAGIKASNESMFEPILAANTAWVTLVGKSWDLHVTESLRTDLDENLAMIADTVSYFCSRDRSVIYDAEHWFDGYKHNSEYALKTLETAIAAGAKWLVLCDTNGGSLPGEISAIIGQVKAKFGDIPLGIHTHNDAGVAVANAIAAVESGVTMVQGTINGYGERCGNANLCTLIPNLQLKMQRPCLVPINLAQLTVVSRQVSEIVNLAPDDHAPYVGLSAFAHKGGMHVSAVQRNPITYEHIAPERVGNSRRIVISEQSGLSNVLAKASSFGIDLSKEDPACKQILQKIKELEQLGYQFEAAEASFELLMRDAMNNRPHFFDLGGFQVHCEPVAGKEVYALATVKIFVNGEEKLTAAEGNGPVSALDGALRKALVDFYPAIANFHLTDYKVRILNGNAGTNAKTRVLIESSNGSERWTTVGVSSNIIEASYLALVESFEYGLLTQKNPE
jgi:2-isopropylmalate synthase